MIDVFFFQNIKFVKGCKTISRQALLHGCFSTGIISLHTTTNNVFELRLVFKTIESP